MYDYTIRLYNITNLIDITGKLCNDWLKVYQSYMKKLHSNSSNNNNNFCTGCILNDNDLDIIKNIHNQSLEFNENNTPQFKEFFGLIKPDYNNIKSVAIKKESLQTGIKFIYTSILSDRIVLPTFITAVGHNACIWDLNSNSNLPIFNMTFPHNVIPTDVSASIGITKNQLTLKQNIYIHSHDIYTCDDHGFIRLWKLFDNNTPDDVISTAPPEVTTTSLRPAVSSSNSLPVNGNATPGDRGGEKVSDGSSIIGMMDDGSKDVLDVTSSGIPVADLREAEGELNREATTASGKQGGVSDVTSGGREVVGNDESAMEVDIELKNSLSSDNDDIFPDVCALPHAVLKLDVVSLLSIDVNRRYPHLILIGCDSGKIKIYNVYTQCYSSLNDNNDLLRFMILPSYLTNNVYEYLNWYHPVIKVRWINNVFVYCQYSEPYYIKESTNSSTVAIWNVSKDIFDRNDAFLSNKYWSQSTDTNFNSRHLGSRLLCLYGGHYGSIGGVLSSDVIWSRKYGLMCISSDSIGQLHWYKPGIWTWGDCDDKLCTARITNDLNFHENILAIVQREYNYLHNNNHDEKNPTLQINSSNVRKNRSNYSNFVKIAQDTINSIKNNNKLSNEFNNLPIWCKKALKLTNEEEKFMKLMQKTIKEREINEHILLDTPITRPIIDT